MPAKAAKKGPDRRRIAAIEKALASDDPLGRVREVISEKGKEGQVVVWAFGCLLETNSATLTMLFDRFAPAEIAKIERALDAIGAVNTGRDLKSLREALAALMDSGVRRSDASDQLDSSPPAKAIKRRSDVHVQEIERHLLAYCRAHVRELAG